MLKNANSFNPLVEKMSMFSTINAKRKLKTVLKKIPLKGNAMLAIAATISKIISASYHRPERQIVLMACFLSMVNVELLTKSVSSLTISQDFASSAPRVMR